VTGTLTYALTQRWNVVVEAFYAAVSILTTTSVAGSRARAEGRTDEGLYRLGIAFRRAG